MGCQLRQSIKLNCEMKSIIIGTAGHIDHGKTTLVKALTGIDTDRLEEEKRRGITIDLGFAHLELAAPSGEKLRLGFVDVPGHERFVRNMLAGVGGIDLVLLVVAADESIKPQTREHFEICRLLSIPRGITVITKADMVDADTLNVVKLEIDEFMRDSFLDTSHAPVVAVSALTGAGLEELKKEIARLAVEIPSRDTETLFRLPIDRVFVMKGFGPVVTGTLIAGKVRKEEEVVVFPARQRVRVRGVQVHGSATDQAIAGQRTALNLAGVQVEELARGMTLAPPDVLDTSQRIDVQLSLLKDARPMKSRARVHLHVFTVETIAGVTFHEATFHQATPQESTFNEANQLKPGSTAFARLRTASPILVLPGDHLILRQFSPVVTIGGAVVLDAFPLRRQKKEATLKFLQAMASGPLAEKLLARIHRRASDGLTVADAVRETGLRHSALKPVFATLLEQKQVVQAGELLVASSAFSAARERAVAVLDTFHKANPLVAGISKEELREKLGLQAGVLEAVLNEMVRERKVEVAGEQIKLAGRGVALKDDEAKAKQEIEKAFSSAGLKVPALKEVLASLPVDKNRAQKLVTLLLRDRVLVKLTDDLVFHQTAIQGLRQILADYKTKSPKIDVAKFKDLTGISRKYAIPLLEYLDRERVTRRVGDERVIL
jgi:selenocysteine-specific elongation factor